MPSSTSKLTGLDLFKIKSKRDYSNSKEDQYAQLLRIVFSHIKADLFPLLERAEQEGKKLTLVEPSDKSIFVSRYATKNILLI
jgi:hypothetical protein